MNKKNQYNILIVFLFLLFQGTIFAQKSNVDYPDTELFDTITGNKGTKTAYTISCSSTPVTCFGLCDGTITINLAGAVIPNYPIDVRLYLPAELGGTSIDFFNIPALPYTIPNLCGAVAAYTIRTVDADGLPYKWGSANVNAPGEMIISDFTQVDETCPGTCNGSVQINFIQNAVYPIFSYLWTDGESVDNITNKCAGIYSVTVTDNNLCTKAFPFTITAPPPLSPTATNTGPYCAGDLIQLNVDAYTSYSWSGPGGFNSILQNPTRPGATPAMAGVYSVTVTDAIGCTGIATTTVVVNALPNATATNNGPVCEGNPLTLTGGVNGLVSYSWSGPLGFLSNSQSPTVSASATVGMSGIYTITVTNINGCTSTATTNVTVNAGPFATATSNSPVCIGQPLTLTGGPNGMTSYSWSGPLAYSNNTQSPTVSASATAGMAGIYTITVTNAGGCTSTATTTVVVNANPVATAASNSPVCIGQPLTLTGGPNGMTTYSWSGPLAYSNNTQSPTVSASATAGMAGIYTITVTNANGCTSTATTNVTINANPVATATSNSPVCVGKPLTLTGGPNGMTSYSWSGPLAYSNNTQSPTVSASATAGMAGIYTITVTNGNGCTSTASTNVVINAVPVATATSNSPVCVGKPLTLTGGPNGMTTYSWSGPLAYSNNTQSPTVSATATLGMAGTYTITITNGNGCTSTASTVVVVNANPLATASSNSPVCIGQPLTLTGGPNGMTTYSWSGPLAYSNNTQSPTVSASATAGMAGIYTITVTNANGCTSTAATNVTVNASPVATALNNSPVCVGKPLTLTGGPNGMASYSWSGPLAYSNNTQSPTVSASATAGMAGVYTLTVTNASGCTSTATTNVIVNALPVATAASNSPVCIGQPLTLTGGPNGMTTYSWSGPLAYSNNTQSPTVSASATAGMAGIYTITVTNANGCTSTATTNVTVNALPVATAASNSPVCIGQPLSLTGGPNGMTTYSWSGPLAYSNNTQSPTVSASATAGMAGIYTITVTNGNGCTSTASTNVTINANPVATATSNSPVCVGKPLTLTGGPNGMTSYSWSGPLAYSNNTQSPTVSATATLGMAGTYTITITNGNGCTSTASTVVVVNANPLATATSNSPVCIGQPLTLTGGPNGMTTYSWSGPLAYSNNTQSPTVSASATAGMAGIYTITVTNANGCTSTATTNVTVNALPVATAASNSPVCIGQPLTLTGGPNGMTSYSWSGPLAYSNNTQNPTVSASATAGMAGIYTITVTNGNGCTSTATTNVVINAVPVATATSNSPVCIGQPLTLTGGPNGMTSYSWSGPLAYSNNTQSPTVSASATAGMAGIYTITVTNGNGCTSTATTNVTVNALPVATATSNSPVCIGQPLTLTGGPNGMTTYSWSGPLAYSNNTQSPTVSASATAGMAGIYTITVTNGNGCTSTATTNVVTNMLSLSETHINTTCYNICDGSIDAEVAGGTAPYTYNWTGPLGYSSTNLDISALCAGVYNLTVSDISLCSATISVTITEPTDITLSEIHGNIAPCFGLSNGWITVTAIGGTGVYTYDWSPDGSVGDGTATYSSLIAGSYTVTVNDIPNGCSKVLGPIDIIQPPDITVVSVDITDALCFGGSTGSFTVHTSGGSPPYEYNIGAGYTTDSTFTNLLAGSYTVTVRDVPGCTTTQLITIGEPTVLTSTISQTDPICTGVCSGTATVTPAGGTGVYTYIWDNPAPSQTTQTATGLCVGLINVTITDSNGCSTTNSTTINAPPSFTASISDSSMSCGSFPTLVAGTTFLPDGTGASYTTTINQTDFAAGSTINSINDISSICLNMEHSWAGDLEIKITCPNNQSQILKTAFSGGGTYIGEPVSYNYPDDSSHIVIQGVGYDYCFVGSGAMFGTMGATSNTFTYTYTDNASNIHNNRFYLPAGTYTPDEAFTNLIGCPINGDWTITVTDNMGQDNGYIFSWQINYDPSTYPTNYCNGSATVTANGGQAPYTYYWSNGATTPAVTDICSGNYCVTITDFIGCTATTCVTITDVNLNIDSFTVSNPSCNGVCNGSITANISGGFAPITYAWSNGQVTQTISNLCAGQYIVTVTEVNGCTATDTIDIINSYSVSTSFPAFTNVACGNTCTGSLTVDATGGGTSYTYTWNPNVGSTATINNLCAGFYFVTVTDNFGCTDTNNFEITDPSDLELNLITSTNPLCFGDCNGSVTLLASGGTPPYIISWPGGGTGTNLCDGDYIVTVTDINLCSDQLIVSMVEPQPLSFSTTITDPVCFGDCNGTATATVIGGTLPYSYLWCNGQNTPTATGLCAGNCGVTISDINSCIVAPQTVTITNPTQLTGTLDITQNITCSGSCNGILTTNHSGGVAPFTYIWSPNIAETTQAADSLCAGTYFVTITDFNGCSIIVTQTLNDPSSVTAVITDSSQVGCHGNCSGTATVLAGGGTGPYTYFWEANSNGYNQITTVADSLCAGTFTVTITDFNLCTAIDSVTIIDTSNLSLSLVSSTNPLCNGNCNGDITVIASGGYPNLISPFYTYSWSNDILNNQPFDNALCSGSYFITVSDDSLCSRILQVDLIDPPLLADSTGLIPITCTTLCDGSAIVFPYGGTGSYSYLWDAIPSQINDTIINLCPNVYHVTVSDANNCTVVDSVTIIAPPAISANITIVDSIACHSDCNGSILANVIGGTPPYTYTWNNTLTNDTLYDLCAGIYDVTVKDANLCSTIATITLGEPDTLQISFNNITQIACGPGNCTGTATAAVIGGSAPYTYIWSANTGGQTDSTAINLCGDIYSVTATDTHGCTIVGTVTITDNSTLSIFISDTNHVTCSGACDGSAVVSASGATPPYTYIWDDSVPTTIDTVLNLCQGTYYVTVYDANLCSRIDSVVITNAAALIVSDSIIPISCSGLCNASISLIPSGGTPPYVTYQWSIAGETDSIATGLCPGIYYYTVTDNNGCQYNDSVTIADPGLMQANITIVDSILCHGVCIGSLTTTPSGSLGPYTFLWSNGDTTQTIIDLCAGDYYLTVTGLDVTGLGGCTIIDTLNLTEPDTLSVTFGSIINPLCNGDSTGTITAIVNGGTPIYSYQWGANAGNATTNMIDTLTADLYFITVTDANGCLYALNYELHDTSDVEITVIDSSMITCYGRCDGWATVRASGGTSSLISPFYTYSWSDFQSDTTAINLCSGLYTVTATDSLACISVKQIEITQPDSMYISIVDSSSITCASICDGSLTVNVFGGTTPYTYNWNNGAIDTIASNLCAGIQQLNISDLHNCQDSLTYNLISPPVITTIVTPVSALCNNNATDGSITVTVSGGVPQYSFLWSNDSTTQNITGLLAGNYWLTITDSLGCTKIDSATIGASIIVNATARWDSTICYGDSVQIFGFGGGIYSWSPSTGLNDSSLFNPWASPLQTTTYYFTVWDSICFDIDSVTIQVFPQIILDAGPDQTILSDHSATLTATSPEISVSYLWNPTLWLTDSINASTIATPLVTTTYYVFATNLNGCVESDSVTITVIPKIIVPTGITPNGDGSNDVWMIDFIDRFPDCEVEIYNRWGEKLFYSKGYPDNERWDGTFKGKALPTGTYYYIINLHDEFDTKPLTGPITIMR